MDLLLGGDNAVVIAMAANKLPENLRKKAILIGTAGAVIIRLVMTFVAVWLLTIPYLQAIGGLILLPIAVKLLVPEKSQPYSQSCDQYCLCCFRRRPDFRSHRKMHRGRTRLFRLR